MMKLISTILLCILLHSTALTQTQTPVYLSQTITNANSRGFYRYLPKDYSTTTKSYPLIIWVHGAGQFGQGNSTDLPKVLEWGVPKIISEGGFPESFRVNGEDYSFIIISPQFMGWPSAVNLAGIISYVSNNYRVDADRIYLMGISAGGGGVWDYASASVANSDKIAAIIPFCGTTNPTKTLAGRIAASKLPVWAFHNTHDGTVPVAYSRNWVNYINTYVPAPSPAAKLTEFPVQSNDAVIAHECWSLATLPTYKPQGINIYEWLLQYKRRIAVVNATPVARAGNDISFVLPATLTLSGTESTDADGMIAVYSWRKVSGPATCSFSDSTAATTIVSNLSPGTYQFELQVTDNGGATATDNITATVYAPIEPGTIQRVLVDIGAGTLTSVSNGLYWNNLKDGRPGVRVSNAVTTLNLPSGIKVEVVNRLDGTYNTSSTGLGTGNTTGVIKDYPASATSDYQMIHSSAKNGLWRISGMDASKVYTIKFWGSRTGTTASRTAEIKRADETIWKSYTATSNTNYDNAAVFIISGKTTMDFNIRTKSGSDFSALSVLDISYGGESAPAVPNNPPVADAGADKLIHLPPNTTTLNGSASSDSDGTIVAWKWRKITGPAMAFSNDAIANPSVNSLTYGTYNFELMVTDNNGATAKDTMVLTVNSPPVANAGADQLVYLPPNTATLNGTASFDPDGIISAWKWRKISGSAMEFSDDAIANPSVGSLTYGVYIFELMVTDSSGATAKDTIVLTVNNPAVANAGPDEVITLPTDTATVSGTASTDVDNSITSYSWTQISGPAANIVSPFLVQTLVIFPAADTYRFELTVTDSRGASAKDSVDIVVSPIPIVLPVADAGPNAGITLPTDTVTLSATASTDADNSIVSYSWRQISGPATDITSPSSVQTLVTFPAADTYQFELTVTNSRGASAKDSVDIIVSPVPNVLPVANAGADTLIHLPPNTTGLDGSASFDSDGTIVAWKWRKISGPSMSFSNSSIANPSVNSLTYGVYSFELMVTDDRGDTGKDTMVLTVNNPPVANAGPNAGITLPANSVTLSGAASGDADGSIQSYSWMQISGIAANITSPSSVQTLATFTAAGTYQFELTVTDNRGIAAKDSVTITVSPEIPPALTKSLRVNVFGGANPYNNAQWNNWNLAGSLTSTRFKYDDGTASNINAVITASALISDNGATYATATTACPPQVLRYSSANTSYRTLTFNGLTNTKTYSLEFYASRANTGNKSTYQIGNKIDTISTDNNMNDVARFVNIIPDNNGRIAVIINRIGTWNYLSGFVITENAETSANMISSRSVSELASMAAMTEKPETESATLVLYPNPGSDIIYLNIPAGVSGLYRLNLVNLSGQTVLQKTGTKRSGGLSDQISIRDLPKGMYLLKLWIQDKTVSSTIIKL